MSKLFLSILILALGFASCGEVCESCTYTKSILLVNEDGSSELITVESETETYCDDELEGVKYQEGTNHEGEYIVSFDCK